MTVNEQIRFYSAEQEKYFRGLVTTIQTYYGTRLTSLAVFGSLANKTNKVNSDCDLLLVLNNATPMSVCERIDEFVKLELSLLTLEDEMTRSGVFMDVSPVILTQEHAKCFNPLYLDMTESCVMLFDKENFLASILSLTKQKMKRWGSCKVETSNGYYWKIKPDIKWNEIIDYDK